MNFLREGEKTVAIDREAQEKFQTLKELGKAIFAESSIVREGIVRDSDVTLAKKFLSKATQAAKPKVWSFYWEHVFLAPAIGRKLAGEAVKRGLNVNPAEVEFLLWLHDIGRLISPSDYLRNEFIGDLLLKGVGIPQEIRKSIPSQQKLLMTGEKMLCSKEQLRFKEPLNGAQRKIAHAYVESQSETERIINLADNLGKRGPKGLFTMDGFIEYLRIGEGRYQQEGSWASVRWAIPRRKAGAVLQVAAIEDTAQWLSQTGIDFEDIRKEFIHYGPKFVIVVRHGELDNPEGKLYSRDAIMAPQDIMHLSKMGEKQMKDVAGVIQERKFHCVRIDVSPETRTQESMRELQKQLNVSTQRTVDDLDDTYAPGPYVEGVKMREFQQMSGDVYDSRRWGNYNHEQPVNIVARMKKAVHDMSEDLRVGQAGVILSHGDPIAWLLNSIASDTMPEPKNLRSALYPAKGQAVAIIFDSENTFFAAYTLNEIVTPNVY